MLSAPDARNADRRNAMLQEAEATTSGGEEERHHLLSSCFAATAREAHAQEVGGGAATTTDIGARCADVITMVSCGDSQWRLEGRVRLVLGIAVAACAMLWSAALFSPSATVVVFPKLPFQETTTRSLVGSIQELWKHGDYLPAFIIALFSLALPVVKLGVQGLVVAMPSAVEHRQFQEAVNIIIFTAPFQMLDIFVGILFVTLFNCDAASAVYGAGFYLFLGYCCGSIIVAQCLEVIFAQAKSLQPEKDDGKLGDVDGRVSGMIVLEQLAVLVSAPWCLLLLVSGTSGLLLELRLTFKGITVDRNEDSAQGVLLLNSSETLPLQVAILVFSMAIIVPAVYIAFLMCSMALRLNGGRNTFMIDAALRLTKPWAMIDVLALAAVLFVVIVQDDLIVTLFPPVSSQFVPPPFFFLLGAGCVFLVLRSADEEHWTQNKASEWQAVDLEVMDPSGSGPGAPPDSSSPSRKKHGCRRLCSQLHIRLLCAHFAWLLLWIAVNLDMQAETSKLVRFEGGVGSICNATHPALEAVTSHLPRSLGECAKNPVSLGLLSTEAAELKAPVPCANLAEPLYEYDRFGMHVEAIWVSGINTLRWNGCKTRETVLNAAATDIIYELSLHGTFQEVNLYLNVRECAGDTCKSFVSSDKECCGSNIRFSLNLEARCYPATGGHAFTIEMAGIDFLDPVTLHESLDLSRFNLGLHGDVNMGQKDIGPDIALAIKTNFEAALQSFSIPWGGSELSLPGLVERLVGYNAPDGFQLCQAET